MSGAAKKTMRYSGSNYDYCNMIDLGTYVDYLSELYPDECEEVRTLLREAVLYKRSNSYLDGSQGLSVYFPTSMGEAYSLFVFTDYVYNISDNPCTNLRGDRYYSPVVEAYVEGGKVSDIKVNVDFVGRSY